MLKRRLKYFDTDYLTGLASRRGLYDFYDRLNENTSIHALFLDVDNFKRVNDAYGHSFGDDLLIQISKLIQKNTDGFCARIGGDEYVILLNSSHSSKEVTTMAENMLAGMDTLDFRRDILSHISLSIGIVLNQPATTSLDEILSKCDFSMYEAKKHGKNRYSVYDEADTTIENRHKIEFDMYHAIIGRQFRVFFQPKVDMVSGNVCGAEALSRWVHPEEGIRLPELYIPIFQKNGFITRLDLYMFEEVCRMKQTWTEKEFAHLCISLNMSRLHLYNRSFAKTLSEIAHRYNIPPSELEIEFSSDIYSKDAENLINTVTALRERGFNVALDNFGSALCTLGVIKDVPANNIKFDRNFINEKFETERDKRFLKDIILICKDLNLDISAVGVESAECARRLYSFGLTKIQGFFFSKPLTLSDFKKFVNSNSLSEKMRVISMLRY
ncbi:MAG: GGDEF and EAL domain-containing protein [Lachnospiraceae bacterium]|nr:GGDEF and EAL domain-containing protein [Lachnospiraceae bacterium]